MSDLVVRLGQDLQGPSGYGQGGWTAYHLVNAMDGPATVAIRRPIPLDTDMVIQPGSADDDPWLLTDPDGATILEATVWEPDFPETDPVSIEDAVAARGRFPRPGDLHQVPNCFSCGLRPDSMRVHSGPLGDGRFATDWMVPPWALTDDGTDVITDAANGCLWAAIDCAAALFVGNDGGFRSSVTAQLAVDIRHPLEAGATYSLVSWGGDWPHDGWDGRKRAAASSAFDADGRCVAVSRSFWIAVDDPPAT